MHVMHCTCTPFVLVQNFKMNRFRDVKYLLKIVSFVLLWSSSACYLSRLVIFLAHFASALPKKLHLDGFNYVCHLDSLIKHYGLIMGSLLGHGLIIFEIGYLLTNISKLSFSKGQIFLSLVNNLLIHTYVFFFLSRKRKRKVYLCAFHSLPLYSTITIVLLYVCMYSTC